MVWGCARSVIGITVIYLVSNTTYIGNNIKNSATCFVSVELSSGQIQDTVLVHSANAYTVGFHSCTLWMYQYCIMYLAWRWFNWTETCRRIFNIIINISCGYWLNKLLYYLQTRGWLLSKCNFYIEVLEKTQILLPLLLCVCVCVVCVCVRARACVRACACACAFVCVRT